VDGWYDRRIFSRRELALNGSQICESNNNMNTPPIPKGSLLAVALMAVAAVVSAQNTSTTGATASTSPPVATGSISGTVVNVNVDGKPMANVSIAYISETQRKARLEADYAALARWATPQSGSLAAVVITPEQRKTASEILARKDLDSIYDEGILAGKTDAKGTFTIKNLPPDQYIVTVINGENWCSVQSVVVKAGAETKLPEPIKMWRVQITSGP